MGGSTMNQEEKNGGTFKNAEEEGIAWTYLTDYMGEVMAGNAPTPHPLAVKLLTILKKEGHDVGITP